jgi:hypothetical protein
MSDQAEFLKALTQRARMQPVPEWAEDSYIIKVSATELQWIDEIAYRIERLEK